MCKKGIVFFLIFLILFATATETLAADNALRKLFRGLTNIAFCWLEIPAQIYKNWQHEKNPLSPLKGLGFGFGFLALRATSGVVEALTFPLPFPNGYQPLLEPELVGDNFRPAPEKVVTPAPEKTVTTAPQ